MNSSPKMGYHVYFKQFNDPLKFKTKIKFECLNSFSALILKMHITGFIHNLSESSSKQ